jgi:tetratricopeptide (TPR) repeat protein
VDALAEIEQGRELYARRAWSDAYIALSGAERETALSADDLELLATAAYMIGREDDYFGALGRAHQAHLNAGEALHAARCALWVAMNLAQRGEMGHAGGWLGRARRLVEREGRECVEQGYLLIPRMFEHEAMGDLSAAIATAAEAAAIAERFGDADLLALAVHSQGHLLVLAGHVKEGLALLDESMVAVTTGELSPIVSGIVYCGVIIGCQAAFDLRRAQEWTGALAAWCREQPDMVAFTGRCLVHRTEILGLRGAWTEALEEARRAVERCLEGQNRRAAGQAAYLQGNLYRLQGSFAAAEQAYREASGHGREPCCGWRKGTPRPHPRRFNGRLERPRIARDVPRSCPRPSRSRWPPVTWRRHAAHASNWRRSPPAMRPGCSTRPCCLPGEPWTSPEGIPSRHWCCCGAHRRPGRSSMRPTNALARES